MEPSFDVSMGEDTLVSLIGFRAKSAPGASAMSGACTPDFLVERSRPAVVVNLEEKLPAQHPDGPATPKDRVEVVGLRLDDLCAKLSDIELRDVQGAEAEAVTPPSAAHAMPTTWEDAEASLEMPAAVAMGRCSADKRGPSSTILSTHGVATDGARKVPRPAWVPPAQPTSFPPPPGLHAPQDPTGEQPGSWPAATFLPVGVPPPPEPWHRPSAPPKLVVSRGSVGHPLQCGGMCEDDECELGSACPRCHVCRMEQQQEKSRFEAEARLTEGPCPSVGSIGHPHACAEACKFYSKARGCKDGAMCTRCHSCRFSKHYRGKPKPVPKQATAS